MSAPNSPTSRTSQAPATTTDQVSLALEAVVSRFADLVRHVGRRHSISETDVDEVMEEVRARLWKAHAARDQSLVVSTAYVYRTASDAALDFIRGRNAAAASAAAARKADAADTMTAAAGEDGIDAATRTQMKQVLGTFAESTRSIVRMYLAGYAREEIAVLLGWTEAKARELLYRGLADLRDRLIEQGISSEHVITDDRLEALYARAIAIDGVKDEGRPCATAEDLRTLIQRAGPEEPRLSVLDHVMSCETCRHSFELLRSIHVVGAIAEEQARIRLKRRRVIPLAIMAAVAAVVVIVFAAQRLGWFGAPDVSPGPADVTLVSPPTDIGANQQPLFFAWRPVPGATAYELEIIGARNVVRFTTRTADTAFSDAGLRLAPGIEYRWLVRAILADGEKITSSARRLHLVPR